MKKRLFELSDALVLTFIAVIVAAVLLWQRANPIDFTMLETNGISYPAATVIDVTSQKLKPSPYDSNRQWGSQKLSVKIEEGRFKGNIVKVHNEVNDTHNIICQPGTRVIVHQEAQEGLDPYFSIYNYDRKPGLFGLILLFSAFMIVIGRIKGLRSLIGLAFAIFLIGCFMLPAFYHGYPVIPVTLVVALVITISSMTLLNGWSAKTRVAITATIVGILFTSLLYVIFSSLLHVSGYNLDSAEDLVFLQQRSNFHLNEILFTCVLISSLGAVLDMTMSLTTALFELKHVHPHLSGKDMFRAGMEMGQDMTGTMSTTLILAFAGSAITMLLVLLTYGTQFNQLLTSDYLAIEMIQSLVGSMAVILAVPLSALLSTWALAGRSSLGSHAKKQ